jgi:hypothetical protein
MDMRTYTLTVLTGPGTSRLIPDPPPEAIDWAIDAMLPVDDYFVILDTENPVERCAFVQTMLVEMDTAAEIKYMTEARFEYGEEYGENFKQYRLFSGDSEKVKTMFRLFALGKVPDISNWEDITGIIGKTAED